MKVEVVMSVAVLQMRDDQYPLLNPAIVNIVGPNGKDSKNRIGIPLATAEGKDIMEKRAYAHELLDRCLDDYESTPIPPTPAGTIKVWSDREVPIAQMEERNSPKVEAGGSNPLGDAK